MLTPADRAAAGLPPEYLLDVTVEPAAEPMTRGEAKAHIRLEVTDDDAKVDRLIRSVRQAGERETGRSWIQQTLRLRMDAFPAGDSIALPRPPAIAAVSVTYVDADDVTQTVPTSVYELVQDKYRPRLVLKPDQVWPSDVRTGKRFGVVVTWTAGYGATAASVPGPYIDGMELLLGHLYENREGTIIGTSAIDLPRGVDDSWAYDRVLPIG